MKLILACYFAVMVPVLTSTDGSGNNSSNDSQSNTFNYVRGDHKDLNAFKENKILVAEFSDIAKNSFGGIMTTTNEKIRARELRQRVTVN